MLGYWGDTERTGQTIDAAGWLHSGDLAVMDDEGRTVVGDMLMKVIRGGAFDTYFPAQATSLFRTGSATLARAHNIGFRCALDLGEKPR